MKHCPACGIQVSNDSQFCTSCGYNMNQQVQLDNQMSYNNIPQNNSTPTNGMAITGFVISLISLILCCGCISIVGLIFSIIGLKRAKANNGAGHGLGVSGLIINIIGILLMVGWFLFAMVPFFVTLFEVM